MSRTLPFIFAILVLFGCARRPAREVPSPSRAAPTDNTVIDASVRHGVKRIVVTSDDPVSASLDVTISFDGPKTVVDGMCESPQGPMRCLWWELRGRECKLMPNYRGGWEKCRDWGNKGGTSRYGFGLPKTSISFDSVDGAITTSFDALTHLQVRVMIGRQGTELD